MTYTVFLLCICDRRNFSLYRNSLCSSQHCRLLSQVQEIVLHQMRCTHSNIWVELFWNSVVNTTEPLISSCVLFWIPNKVVSLSPRNTASPGHGDAGSNNTTARIIAPPSFIAYTFGRCFANLPTQWRRRVGCVWMSRFRGTWSSLNFDKEYLFGFETLVFAASGILSMHKQLVTLQRERNTWNHIIWPL